LRWLASQAARENRKLALEPAVLLAGLFSTRFVKLVGKHRRFLSAGLSVTAIGLYTILVGAEAAVVRPALMGALALFARQVGRQQVLATSRSGAVLQLEWRNFRTLLPIGLDNNLCQALLEEPGSMPVNAFLLAGSGAAELTPPEWLQVWEPQVVLLSVGTGDRRALPAPQVLQAMQGYTLLRSDQNGWVQLSTDGE
jgi:hypothetical protein